MREIESAIDSLAEFMHNFCMNLEETEKQGEPIFRCKDCAFCDGNFCKAKEICSKYGTEEQKEQFNCMQ